MQLRCWKWGGFSTDDICSIANAFPRSVIKLCWLLRMGMLAFTRHIRAFYEVPQNFLLPFFRALNVLKCSSLTIHCGCHYVGIRANASDISWSHAGPWGGIGGATKSQRKSQSPCAAIARRGQGGSRRRVFSDRVGRWSTGPWAVRRGVRGACSGSL